MATDLDEYVGALDWIVLIAAVVAFVFLVLTLRQGPPPPDTPDAA